MGIVVNGHFDVDQKIPAWVGWKMNMMPELIDMRSSCGLT